MESATFLRSNLPIEFSKKLDFVGLDIYMDSFLVLSPHFIQNLQAITHKDVVITEFGMSTSDSLLKATTSLEDLTFSKVWDLRAAGWSTGTANLDNYGIRGTPTEKAVGDWIAQNAK